VSDSDVSEPSRNRSAVEQCHLYFVRFVVVAVGRPLDVLLPLGTRPLPSKGPHSDIAGKSTCDDTVKDQRLHASNTSSVTSEIDQLGKECRSEPREPWAVEKSGVNIAERFDRDSICGQRLQKCLKPTSFRISRQFRLPRWRPRRQRPRWAWLQVC
jgi:hypothetical protein